MPHRQRLVLILLVPLTAVAIALMSGIAAHPSARSPDDLRLASSFYLSAASAQWLALVALAPLVVALVFAWRLERPAIAYFQPEFIGTYGWWITFANGYAATYMVALSSVLPKFDPALRSLDDPRLRAVPLSLMAAAIIMGVVLFFIWFIFGRQFGFGRMADRISLPHRRTALLVLLTVVSAAVWIFGGLAFSLLIVPATWCWIFIEPRTSREGQALNAALAVGGIAAFAVAYFRLPGGLNLWHLVLAAGYGVLVPFDALAFLLMAALFIRFLRLGLSAPYAHPQSSELPVTGY